tara:strand:- start:155 stop:826 length:672 start_codon:yes stop_codon:yes gene_type:complete
MERKEDLPLLGFRHRHSKAACHAVKQLCRNRASQRWSALLKQAKSCIGFKCGMRKRLGEVHWESFVKFAEAHHKEAFFQALIPSSGVLCCEGALEGAPCPKAIRIDLRSVSVLECGDELPKLHLDHTQDVKHVCKIWSLALPEDPQSWDEGICGPLVAHLLFGTKDHMLAQCSNRAIWRKQVVPHCGNIRGGEKQRVENVCHDVAGAHYTHALLVEDIRWLVH